MNNTTRRYPRSTLEAFGSRGDVACAIERPPRRERIAGLILAVAIGVLATAAVVAWATEPAVAVEMTEAEKKAELRKQRWKRAIEASFRAEEGWVGK